MNSKSVPIAVIGASCRFPQCNSVDEYWTALVEGRDCITEPPTDRPYLTSGDIPFKGGFLSCPIVSFDAKFFGFNPRDSPFIDPQVRVLLECSWEALELAGINPHSLKGSDTGVFLGIWQQDYDTLLPSECFVSDDFHRKWLCNAFSCAASRLAHILGLNGPALPYEAACASSLVAIHNACESLRAGSTSLAIASGVNLILSDAYTAALPGSSVLAPDFKCKSFDASANGYVRSEGCGVVILKRLADAERDGDPILGVVLGSACNTDGAGTSFGAPNPSSQAKVFAAALAAAGVEPEQVSYVEAHGTGTAVGDPTEMKAIQMAYSTPTTTTRRRELPLLIGAVKPNIGHTEAAAGIASFIKVLRCLNHKIIPPVIHFRNLNPKLELEAIPAKIPTELTQWPPAEGQLARIAAVNTFGMSGVNVHVVLEEYIQKPAKEIPENSTNVHGAVQIVPIAAKSPAALEALKLAYIKFLEESGPATVSFDDLAFTAATGRAHFPHRMAIVASNLGELKAGLHQSIYNQPIKTKTVKTKANNNSGGQGRVAFLFTGQGSQYFGMAKDLYGISERFKAELHRMDALYEQHLHISLLTVLWSHESYLNSTLYCQPAIFCIQIALVSFWKEFGLIPGLVLGHSLGEFAAAVCAGVLTAEDGMNLVAGRAKLIEQLSPKGAMLAVSTATAGAEQQYTGGAELLKQFQKSTGVEELRLEIAALNSPTDTVFSGPKGDILQFEMWCLNNKGLKAKRLNSSHAFHSAAMEPILNAYDEQLLRRVDFQAPNPGCTYISSITGKGESSLSPAYWKAHVRNTVQFSQAVKTLLAAAERVGIVLELGPQPVLIGILKQNMAMGTATTEATEEMLLLHSMRRNEEIRNSIATTLSKLYMAGIEFDWSVWFNLALAAPNRVYNKIQLPTYQFQRQRHWFDDSNAIKLQLKQRGLVNGASASADVLSGSTGHHFLGRQILSSMKLHTFESTLDMGSSSASFNQFSYLLEHKIGGVTIFPAAAFLEMFLALGKQLFPAAQQPIGVEDLNLEAALELNEETATTLQTLVSLEGRGGQVHLSAEIRSRSSSSAPTEANEWETNATARLVPHSPAAASQSLIDTGKYLEHISTWDTPEEIHAQFYSVGFTFGSKFQQIIEFGCNRASGEVVTKVLVPSTTTTDQDTSSNTNTTNVCHPILSDAMLQTGVYTILKFTGLENLALPIKCNKFIWYGGQQQLEQELRGGQELLMTTSWAQPGDINLYTAGGLLLARVEGLEFYHTKVAAFLNILEKKRAARASARAEAVADKGEGEEGFGLYKEIWEPVASSGSGSEGEGRTKAKAINTAPAAAPGPVTWLIISDVDPKSQISARLTKPIMEAGHHVVHASFHLGDFQHNSLDSVRLKYNNPAQYKELLESIQQNLGNIVLYFQEPANALALAAGDQNILEATERLTLELLYLTQAIIQLQLFSIGFHLVTTSSSSSEAPVARPGLELTNPINAALHGFVKAFRTENPQITRVTASDLDVDLDMATWHELWLNLTAENLGSCQTGQTIIREGTTYAPKLVALPPRGPKTSSRSSSISSASPLFSPSRTYLITGATRGIGLEVFKFMLENGAEYFILTARSQPAAEVLNLISSLNQDVVKVALIMGDVSSREHCQKLVALASAAHDLDLNFPPLGGIFHSAGVISDALIQNQTHETLARCLHAKVHGAWHLHSLTSSGAGVELDYFVLFSSIVSLIGNFGQSNYIAANSFLDSLVQSRTRAGLCGTTINWGAWSEIGMAAGSQIGKRDGGALGMSPISPGAGIRALAAILEQKPAPPAQVAVLGQPTYFTTMGQLLGITEYLADLVEAESKKSGGSLQAGNPGNDELTKLQSLELMIKNGAGAAAADPPSPQAVVAEYVELIVRGVLGVKPEEPPLEPDVSFSAMGMDSLMYIELRAHLKNLVPGSNLVQDSDTLESLSNSLLLALASSQQKANVNSTTLEHGLGRLGLESIIAADSILPADITCIGNQGPTRPSQWQAILLTGATGFVGAQSLGQLAQSAPHLKIFCLVRAVRGVNSKERLKASLEKFNLLQLVDVGAQVSVIEGDVALANLGLPLTSYEELCTSIDAVVHCAAAVNHLVEYEEGGVGSSMRSQNVHGLVNVIRFVCEKKTKPIFFPSSLTAATALDSSGRLLDEFPGYAGNGNGAAAAAEAQAAVPKAGYLLSKHIGEKLLGQAAAQLGVPTTVFRFPTLFGAAASGRRGLFGTKYNHFSRLLQTCLKIGHLPDWGREEIPVMAVDVGVAIAIKLFLTDGVEDGVYNLTFDSMPTESDFKFVANSLFGIELDHVPFTKWTQLAIQDEQSLLKPFKQLYELPKDGSMPKITRWNNLYTHLLRAKLNETSPKLVRNFPGEVNVNELFGSGKEVLEQHLAALLAETEPELVAWNNVNEE